MRVSLGDNEQKVLNTLARSGVMSPSQVSAETWLLPGDALKALDMLHDFGLVLMRDDTDSADGKLVVLTSEGRDLAEKETFRQQMRMYK